MSDLLSIIIPSRNEQFLTQTIIDLLAKASQDIEIIAVLDGVWGKDHVEDNRVHYLKFGESKGMRASINAGVALAKGKYILKSDGHCLFAHGFDEILKRDSRPDWVQIPRREALDPKKWQKRTDQTNKYPIDYMFLTCPIGGVEVELSGREWREKNQDQDLKGKLIDDAMSFQGSCWFMEKSYFEWLELEDVATYGTFWKEAQEIGFKVWLSGGRVVRNKKTWYAHLHKGSKYGRGYKLTGAKGKQAQANVARWLKEKAWHKQKYPFAHMIRRFPDAPHWTEAEIRKVDYHVE